MPKVSICIPAYRQTRYLRKTLDSVLYQDFDDYEIVISDDSQDQSVENLLDRYRFGNRLIYFKNSKQLGSPANWNKSVRISSGEYVKLLHHDDWFSGPSSLSAYVEMIESDPKCGFAFSGATGQIHESGKTWHHFATRAQRSLLKTEKTSLFNCNFIGPPSATILRRKAFTDYDENLTWVVDIESYISALIETQFVATQKPLITSISHAPHQITGSCIKDRCVNIFEYFYLFDKIKKHIPTKSMQTYIDTLINLIVTYDIVSLEEIHQCGYGESVPVEVLASLKWPPLVRSAKKLRMRVGSIGNALKRKLINLRQNVLAIIVHMSC